MARDMSKPVITLSVLGLALAVYLIVSPMLKSPLKTRVYVSDVHHIEQIYPSMAGPKSGQENFYLERTDRPELLWVTGYRVTMIADDTERRLPDELMCHVNVNQKMTPNPYIARSTVSRRMVSLSQGVVDVNMPEGFGFPLMSNEPVDIQVQVLNMNEEDADIHTRHRVEIDYLTDSDADKPMVPLFMTAAWGLKVVYGDSAYYGRQGATEEDHGSGCSPGAVAFSTDADFVVDQFGNQFTGHWVLEPGREENHTLVTNLLMIPYDTTLHYATVHVHPFAESLELRDLTEDKTVWKARIHNRSDLIGIERADQFVSREGVPIYKDHEYTLISVYNNTTGVAQDSMAVMYLYLRDRQFQHRAPA